MHCNMFRYKIGAYLDNELPEHDRILLEEHRNECPACTAEEESLRDLFGQLEEFRVETESPAPIELWPLIGGRLRACDVPRRAGLIYRLFRRPIAAVASLALMLGTAGLVSVWLTSAAQVAKAESIDYSLLLDHLSQGLDSALDKFLSHYHAEPIPADRAHAAAPDLSFSLPQQLPTGQRLEVVYRLDFNGLPGIAARYGSGKPIIVLFHKPTEASTGAHSSTPCIVGERHGEETSVGAWHLVHFTDPTTCHCVLSMLEPTSELSAVLDVIAPGFGSNRGQLPYSWQP